MKKRTILALSLISALAVGCETNTKIKNTYEMVPKSPWPDSHRKVALNGYLYAQMANNTYGQAGDKYDSDGNDFVLPASYSSEHFPNDGVGFAYSVYRKIEGGKLKEVVLAFRGTEGLANYDDAIFGNLLARQNPRAIAKYKEIRSELNTSGNPDVPIVLTGHSLGGALAVHTALNVAEEVPYFVFNSSPRFKLIERYERYREPEILFQIRNSVVETGEFLYSLRFPATEATQTYTPFDCERNFKPFSSHGIEKLATCLTMVAALNDPNAKIEKRKKNSGAAI